MSLKSFITQKNINSMLKEMIKKPKLDYKKHIQVEAQSNNYTIVGIAFDYLMRIYLYRLNKEHVQRLRMIAEDVLSESLLGRKNYKIAVKVVDQSKKQIDKYLKDGILRDDLLASCLQLSHLDIIKRSSIVPDNFGNYDKMDLVDLRNLFIEMEKHDWKSQKICELNPNFQEASLLVGGADADLIIDDTLIDIKTIKSAGITRQHFNQLIGYYLLSRIEGRIDIRRLGIYSARYSDFICFNISDIIPEEDIERITKWFYDEAYKQYGSLYELAKIQRELLETM